MNDHKPTILVVDDDFAIRTLLEFTLKGYNTLFAEDGDSAIKTIRLNLPDLVILDLMMPRVDGFEVLKKIKSELFTKNTYVMIVSAKHHPNDLKKSITLGVDEYLTKPFEPEKVRKRIDQIMQNKDQGLQEKGINKEYMGTIHYIKGNKAIAR